MYISKVITNYGKPQKENQQNSKLARENQTGWERGGDWEFALGTVVRNPLQKGVI